MVDDIDPYRILDLKKNFTKDELREAYKKLALQVHPDRGGTDYMFKLVTYCYKLLCREYNNRISDKQYHELKEAFKKKEQVLPPARSENKFNIDKFNRVFEENKMESIQDSGYGDFLKDTPARDEPTKFQGKITQETFNRKFEEHTPPPRNTTSKFMVKYKEPEPLMASKKMAFTVLGEDSIDDFSGDNMTKKNLNFMDLKLAHTTSRIVDPKKVKARKEYKTIYEFEADRGSISFQMSEKDRIYYEKQQKIEQTKEEMRLKKLAEQDVLASQHFQRLHNLLRG
jgi:curved DNA-binding protein CbpA